MFVSDKKQTLQLMVKNSRYANFLEKHIYMKCKSLKELIILKCFEGNLRQFLIFIFKNT